MQVYQNQSLKDYNSFRIESRAKYFANFTSVERLEELLSLPTVKFQPKLVIGGGSNILLTGNFEGLVLKNDIKGIERVSEDGSCVYVKAGAGENWHQFVLYCLANNFAGTENLSLIPGSVGASPMQNIGAYGVELKDLFHSLEAFDLQEKKLVQFGLNDCAFGYRESVFKHRHKGRFIIVNVTYRLFKQPSFNTSYGAIETELSKMNVQELSIQAISQAVINIRRSKLPDPAVIGNAGSFFKNPEVSRVRYESLKAQFPSITGHPQNNNNIKLAAGWMIEQCGWKGYRKGDAGCHASQALVLVNYGNATGKEILQLSKEIAESVKEKFGVELETEVNLVG